MAKNSKISILCMRGPELCEKTGNYAAYEKSIKKHLAAHIEQVLNDSPDLIILPEGCGDFSRPATMEDRKDNLKFYEYLKENLIDFFKTYAIDYNTNIAASVHRYFPEDTEFPFRNSTVYIGRNGEINGIYDKNHLVPWENEISYMGYGKDAKVIELDIGRVASAICYDLNFDELLYKYKEQDPELIVFCSAYHGAVSQQIWAYNCRAYFAGALRCGNGRILNPFGEVVAQTTNYTNYVTASVNLDFELCHIDENRPKFKAAKEKYKTDLTIYDPGYAGSVMLTCENPDMNIQDIIDEFEIERLDSYFDRARNHRKSHI